MKTIALLFLVGCGPLQYNVVCEQSEVALAGGEHENFDCPRLVHNIQVAKRMLTTPQRWWGGTIQVLADEAEWRKEISGVSIWVSRDSDLDDDGLSGQYDGVRNEVMLARDEKSLLHELLHRIDTNHLRFWTVEHEGWFTNGYDALSADYRAFYQKPR